MSTSATFYHPTSVKVEEVKKYLKFEWVFVTKGKFEGEGPIEDRQYVTYKYPSIEKQIEENWEKFVSEIPDSFIQNEIEKGYLTFWIYLSNTFKYLANSSKGEICKSIGSSAMENYLKTFPLFQSDPEIFISIKLGL